jgi:hypothetical protein
MFREIRTTRLTLRDLRPSDADCMSHYRSDPSVSQGG